MAFDGQVHTGSPFGLQQHEKTDIVLDGAKVYSMARALGRDIDYKELRAYFDQNCNLRRAHYYTTLVEEEGVHNPVRPLTDWLGYNGFHTVVREAREVIDPEVQRRVVLGSVNVEMGIDMVDLAQYTDHVVLFSNTGDLTYAVEKLLERNVKVTLVSMLNPGFKGTCPPNLRRAVEGRFVDFSDVADLLCRPVRRSNA